MLDVGCGTGALTRELARRGHQVTGIDFSAPAIETARAKAVAEDLIIDFRVADATRLQDLGVRPATVFDSGLLHSLDETGARAYVAGLEQVCVSGATVCILAMSAEGELGWVSPKINSRPCSHLRSGGRPRSTTSGSSPAAPARNSALPPFC